MRRAALIMVGAGATVLCVVFAAARVGERAGALSNWQALALGLVQGLTELLPISSSGHLVLVPWLADWRYLEQHDAFNHTFDVGLHLGTLVAVVAYFAADIARLLRGLVRSLARRSIRGDDERLAWLVIAATIPAVIVGVAGESTIEKHLGEPWQIAILLSVFAVVLWLADRRPQRREPADLGFKGAVLGVGLAQCLSLMPGVSRSGITISAGRLLGLTRDAAARFSFLLLVPVTLGAVAYKGLKDVVLADLPPGSAGPFAVGMIAAAVSGFAAIHVLLGYVRRHDYSPFVLYRLLAALAVAIVIVSGARGAGF